MNSPYGGICGRPWWMIFRSVPQTPQARTRTRTSSSPGTGTGRSWSSKRCGATTALTLDEFNPASFGYWLRDDVDGAVAKSRHERLVAWHQHPYSGKGFWSIARFDDVTAATRDWETFSSSYVIQAMSGPEDM